MGRCSWTSHPSKNGSVTTASTMNETSALNSIMIVKWTTTSWLILIRPLVAPPHGSLSPTRLHQNLSGVSILPLSTIMTLVMRLTTLTMVVTRKLWTLCYTTAMVFFHRKPQPRGLRTIWRIRQLWNGKLSSNYWGIANSRLTLMLELTRSVWTISIVFWCACFENFRFC
jgi:hypothetical protein